MCYIPPPFLPPFSPPFFPSPFSGEEVAGGKWVDMAVRREMEHHTTGHEDVWKKNSEGGKEYSFTKGDHPIFITYTFTGPGVMSTTLKYQYQQKLGT